MKHGGHFHMDVDLLLLFLKKTYICYSCNFTAKRKVLDREIASPIFHNVVIMLASFNYRSSEHRIKLFIKAEYFCF